VSQTPFWHLHTTHPAPPVPVGQGFWQLQQEGETSHVKPSIPSV
jgi:hypothetical protein